MLIGSLGVLGLFLVSLDRNSYKIITTTWFNTPVEIIESPITSDIFTIVCHGYAGSSEMMKQLAFDIASGGSNVVLFDFIGHGQHEELLINKPQQIAGTTQQLVDQLERVIEKVHQSYGAGIKIFLVGHSMASDIVIRASKSKKISSVVAISPYSTAINETFPHDLLLISGQFEGHLRSMALNHINEIAKNAKENETVFYGDLRRKASFIKNTGHVSVIYAPQTSKEINKWLGLNIVDRNIANTHIVWIFFSAILLLLFVVNFFHITKTTIRTEKLSFARAILIMCIASLIAGSSVVLHFRFLPIYGFSQLAFFFGISGLSLVFFFKWLGLKADWAFNFRKFSVVLTIFFGISIFVNEFIGSFYLHGYRFTAFMGLIIPLVIFSTFSEQIAQGTKKSLVFAVRLTPLFGLVLSMALSPQNLGLMFTTVPIYILYFLVFGYVGKSYRDYAGPCAVGICHGIFLSYSFAATTPLFALP